MTRLGIQSVKEPAGFNKKVISRRLPLEELQRGIERIERGNEPVYKVMILPNG